MAFWWLHITFLSQNTRFEELALGQDTLPIEARVEDHPIYCTGITDAAGCLDGWRQRGEAEVLLWLGNSQTYSINQPKPGDQIAPALLFDFARAKGLDLLAFSQPNANLQEHYVLFEYLRLRLPVKWLVLPLVFDDLRETGIRAEIVPALSDQDTAKALSETAVGTRLLQLGNPAKEETTKVNESVYASLQDRCEQRLSNWLDRNWPLWASREQARGWLFLNLYKLRNTIFGITPQTKRKIIQTRYLANMEALQAICSSASASGIRVLCYIAPVRQDIDLPYDREEYSRFKIEAEQTVSAAGQQLINLESIVLPVHWGKKETTAIGGDKMEVDFMHFQGQGHKVLAQALQDCLNGNGFP